MPARNTSPLPGPIDEEWMMTHKELIKELQELDFEDFVHQVKERFYGLKVNRQLQSWITQGFAAAALGKISYTRRIIHASTSRKHRV